MVAVRAGGSQGRGRRHQRSRFAAALDLVQQTAVPFDVRSANYRDRASDPDRGDRGGRPEWDRAVATSRTREVLLRPIRMGGWNGEDLDEPARSPLGAC